MVEFPPRTTLPSENQLREERDGISGIKEYLVDTFFPDQMTDVELAYGIDLVSDPDQSDTLRDAIYADLGERANFFSVAFEIPQQLNLIIDRYGDAITNQPDCSNETAETVLGIKAKVHRMGGELQQFLQEYGSSAFTIRIDTESGTYSIIDQPLDETAIMQRWHAFAETTFGIPSPQATKKDSI